MVSCFACFGRAEEEERRLAAFKQLEAIQAGVGVPAKGELWRTGTPPVPTKGQAYERRVSHKDVQDLESRSSSLPEDSHADPSELGCHRDHCPLDQPVPVRTPTPSTHRVSSAAPRDDSSKHSTPPSCARDSERNGALDSNKASLAPGCNTTAAVQQQSPVAPCMPSQSSSPLRNSATSGAGQPTCAPSSFVRPTTDSACSTPARAPASVASSGMSTPTQAPRSPTTSWKSVGQVPDRTPEGCPQKAEQASRASSGRRHPDIGVTAACMAHPAAATAVGASSRDSSPRSVHGEPSSARSGAGAQQLDGERVSPPAPSPRASAYQAVSASDGSLDPPSARRDLGHGLSSTQDVAGTGVGGAATPRSAGAAGASAASQGAETGHGMSPVHTGCGEDAQHGSARSPQKSAVVNAAFANASRDPQESVAVFSGFPQPTAVAPTHNLPRRATASPVLPAPRPAAVASPVTAAAPRQSPSLGGVRGAAAAPARVNPFVPLYGPTRRAPPPPPPGAYSSASTRLALHDVLSHRSNRSRVGGLSGMGGSVSVNQLGGNADFRPRWRY